MNATIITLLLGLSLCTLSGQIRWEELSRVASGDKAMPTLLKWQQSVADNYQKGGVIQPSFSSWFELPFPSLTRIFPGQRFFAISWMERPVPGKEKEAIGLGGGEYTLICDADGKLVEEIYHYGNYDPFGKFLASKKVPIRSAEDARLVWEAFCDLHQKHWKEQSAIKVSDTEWHLGNETRDGVHYYYKVVLDASQVIASARLRADHLEQPKSN